MRVIYRACSTGSINKNRPISDKYKLVKTCFESFIEAFSTLDYELLILLDKPTNRFRELFADYNVEESFYGSFTEGNVGSFHRQLDLAVEGNGSYFLVEDDYFFLPKAGKILGQALYEFDFLSPYDHPEHYKGDFKEYTHRTRVSGGHHWQSIPSTTLTFGGKTEILKQEIDTMKGYGWGDHPMWLDVLKRHTLWSPIPSLATHMETEFLSPVINWPF